MPLEQVVQRTTIDNLDIITAGPEVDNPAELLSSPRLKELLDEFRQSYEVIILDAPPVLAVTDPAIVGAVADGIVVVVHASTLRHHDAARTRELLDNLGTPVLGMIVNGIGHADSGYGYGYGLWLRLWQLPLQWYSKGERGGLSFCSSAGLDPTETPYKRE